MCACGSMKCVHWWNLSDALPLYNLSKMRTNLKLPKLSWRTFNNIIITWTTQVMMGIDGERYFLFFFFSVGFLFLQRGTALRLWQHTAIIEFFWMRTNYAHPVIPDGGWKETKTYSARNVTLSSTVSISTTRCGGKERQNTWCLVIGLLRIIIKRRIYVGILQHCIKNFLRVRSRKV